MKFLKVLLYIVLGLAAVLVVLGLFGKKDYHIERSLDIKAPKSIIAEQVSCFKNFDKWSPWADLDPAMTKTFEGTDCQVGSVYKWAGNDNVGSGKQTLKAVAPDRVDIEVQFTDPWESTSPTFIKMDDIKGGTKVTWGFDMSVPFPWNGLAMFTDVDKGIGADYEKGLARLKTLCEELAAHPKYNGYEVAEVEVPLQQFLAIRKTVAFADMAKFFQDNMPTIMSNNKLGMDQMAGPPSGIFWTYDEAAQKSDMAVAVPIASAIRPAAGYSIFPIGGRKAAVVDYYGPYETTGKAHEALDAYLKAKGLEFSAPCMEQYITDPMAEPDTAKWLTKVVYFFEEKKVQ